MSGTYALGGQLFPKNPLTKTWRRQGVGVHGTNEPIFGALWQLDMSFGTLKSQSEASFYETKFIAGQPYTAILPHPLTGELVGFTGVHIASFDYDFNDVDRNTYASNGRLVLEHINLSATGTV